MSTLNVIMQKAFSLLAGEEVIGCDFVQDGTQINIRGHVYFTGAGTIRILQKNIWFDTIKSDSSSITGAGSIYFNLLLYGHEILVYIKNDAGTTQTARLYITTD